MSEPHIRVINYDDTGTEIVREVISLGEKDQFSIGRSQNADIKIMDIKVSRSHSRIERRAEKFYIVDLGSRNGTYVNGERITTHELINGDNIKVGFSILRYEEPEPEVREPEPEPKAAVEEAVYNCHMCQVNVTETQLRTGKAEQIAGKVYCAACVKKTDELFRQALVEDSQEIEEEEEEELDIPAGGSLADMIEEDDDEADLDLLPDD
ncbi:MAG: FHA domain-containing protein [Planctomycetota bacterium]|jgi:pSer/pThr/pTyr-binding forkhead associated (FHA) protein